MGYPIERNLTVRTNEDLSRVWQWKPGGNAQDFTGWTAALKVRADGNDAASSELADWGSLVTLDASGNITLDVPQATVATAAGTWTIGFWDLVLTDGDGDKKNLIRGSIRILPGMS